MPKPTRGREKVRVAKSRWMPRQRSPSRVSCRLAVKQQTLGAGWSAYRSNLGTPSRSTHGPNYSACRQRSHGYLRQRVCAHSYGTKTLIQNRWQLRSDESATKTLADPSAGRQTCEVRWARQKFESTHALQRACGCVYAQHTSDTSAKRIGMIARARRRAEQAEHRAQLGCT